MAPSLKGLQRLIDILEKSICNISQKINVNKSKYIVKGKKIYRYIYILESSVKLFHKIIGRVSQCIYF